MTALLTKIVSAEALLAKVNTIVTHLVPAATLEQLALDAVPREVESAVYNAGMQISAVLSFVIAQMDRGITLAQNPEIQLVISAVPLLSAYFNEMTAFRDLCVTIKSEIDAVAVPPAGSALLKLLPVIVTRIEDYIKAAELAVAEADVVTRAVVAHATQAPMAAPVETAAETPAAPPTVTAAG